MKLIISARIEGRRGGKGVSIHFLQIFQRTPSSLPTLQSSIGEPERLQVFTNQRAPSIIFPIRALFVITLFGIDVVRKLISLLFV